MSFFQIAEATNSATGMYEESLIYLNSTIPSIMDMVMAVNSSQ